MSAQFSSQSQSHRLGGLGRRVALRHHPALPELCLHTLAADLQEEWSDRRPAARVPHTRRRTAEQINRAIWLGVPKGHRHNDLVVGAFAVYLVELSTVTVTEVFDAGYDSAEEYAAAQAHLQVQAEISPVTPLIVGQVSTGIAIAEANLGQVIGSN